MMTLRALFTSVFLFCIGSVYAEDASLQRLTPDWPGPMNPIPQGVPVANGPVLFLCHRSYGRDAAELKLRVSNECRAVFYGGYNEARNQRVFAALSADGFNGWGLQPELYEQTGPYNQALLAERLTGARLLCMDRYTWAALPADIRDDLRQRIEAGLGLLMAEPAQDQFKELEAWLGKGKWQPMTTLHPNLRLRGFAKAQICRWTAGQGRVSILRFPRETGMVYLAPHNGDRAMFNQGLLLTQAEMAWAGQRAGGLELLKIDLQEQMSWQPGPVTVPIRVRAADAMAVTVTTCLNDDRGEVLSRTDTTSKVPAGESTIELAINLGPAGDQTLYVQAEGQAAAAVSIAVSSPATLVLKPVQEVFGPAVPIEASLELDKSEPGDVVTVSATDWWGRDVASTTIPTSDGTQTVSLSAPNPTSRYQELRATLSRGGLPLRVERVPVYRQLPHAVDDFQLYLWRGSYDVWWSILGDLRLADLGQNCVFSAGSGNRYLYSAMKHNYELFSITHTCARSIDKLCDPAFLDTNVKTLSDIAAGYDQLGGAWAVSHGDELYVRATAQKDRDWRQEPAKSALLAYLQRRYQGDIANLNAAWGTQFADFASLEVPDDLDIPKEPRAPWLDYCFFLEDVFCGYLERLNHAVTEKYPNARIGLDGIEKYSCFDGINWPRLQASQDAMVIYPHIDHDNKLYSWRAAIDFKRPGTVGGFWLAYGSDLGPEVAGAYPWMALFNGLESIGYFQGFTTSERFAALYPDWRARPAYAATAKSVQTIRGSGADKLLLNAERVYSPIAIHYSPRSLALSFPDSGITNHINQLGFWSSYRIYRKGYVGHTANAGTAWMMMLSDMGYKPRFVDTGSIEAGALADYKVLVLPLSQSLTQAEVEAIEGFVRGGGMVIADYHCGSRDENGNLLATGALDDIFGLRAAAGPPAPRKLVISDFMRRPPYVSSMLALTLDETLTPDAPTLVEPPADTPDWSPAVAHGEAAGGIPVMLARPCGDGFSLYLNFSVEPYMQWRHDEKGLPLRESMADILRKLGRVGPAAQVVRTESRFIHDRAYIDAPAIGPQLHPFRDGVAEYLGIYWDYKRSDWGPEEQRLKMVSPAHLYNVLTGDYLGFTATTTMQVEGCPAALYARLPYRVTGVEVTGPAQAASGKPVTLQFAVQAAANTLAPHALRVTVRNAAGKDLPALTTTLRAPEGRVAWTFVPAFQETGDLHVVVRDVASGMSGEHVLTVAGQ